MLIKQWSSHFDPCLTHLGYILLMTSQMIADNITMTRQLGRDHMNSDI